MNSFHRRDKQNIMGIESNKLLRSMKMVKKTVVISAFGVVIVGIMYFVPLLYCRYLQVPSELDTAESTLLFIQEKVQGRNWYVDDYDLRDIEEIALTLRYFKGGYKIRETNRARYMLEYLNIRLNNLLSQMKLKQQRHQELKEFYDKYPQGKTIPANEYDKIIAEAKIKDNYWKKMVNFTRWTTEKGDLIKIDVQLRDFMIKDNHLIPVNHEEGVMARYKPITGDVQK